MLVLSRRVGDAIMIGHDVKVTVLSVSRDQVRIGIEAPRQVEVHREEVYLQIQAANVQAAASSPAALAGLAGLVATRHAAGDSPGPGAEGAAVVEAQPSSTPDEGATHGTATP